MTHEDVTRKKKPIHCRSLIKRKRTTTTTTTKAIILWGNASFVSFVICMFSRKSTINSSVGRKKYFSMYRSTQNDTRTKRQAIFSHNNVKVRFVVHCLFIQKSTTLASFIQQGHRISAAFSAYNQRTINDSF